MTEVNKEIMKEYMREYYIKNRNKWSDKIICDICNISYCKTSRHHHLKSKRHKMCVDITNKKNLELNNLKIKINEKN